MFGLLGLNKWIIGLIAVGVVVFLFFGFANLFGKSAEEMIGFLWKGDPAINSFDVIYDRSGELHYVISHENIRESDVKSVIITANYLDRDPITKNDFDITDKFRPSTMREIIEGTDPDSQEAVNAINQIRGLNISLVKFKVTFDLEEGKLVKEGDGFYIETHFDFHEEVIECRLARLYRYPPINYFFTNQLDKDASGSYPDEMAMCKETFFDYFGATSIYSDKAELVVDTCSAYQTNILLSVISRSSFLEDVYDIDGTFKEETYLFELKRFIDTNKETREGDQLLKGILKEEGVGSYCTNFVVSSTYTKSECIGNDDKVKELCCPSFLLKGVLDKIDGCKEDTVISLRNEYENLCEIGSELDFCKSSFLSTRATKCIGDLIYDRPCL